MWWPPLGVNSRRVGTHLSPPHFTPLSLLSPLPLWSMSGVGWYPPSGHTHPLNKPTPGHTPPWHTHPTWKEPRTRQPTSQKGPATRDTHPWKGAKTRDTHPPRKDIGPGIPTLRERITYRHLWKYSLPPTSLAGGKNVVSKICHRNLFVIGCFVYWERAERVSDMFDYDNWQTHHLYWLSKCAIVNL